MISCKRQPEDDSAKSEFDSRDRWEAERRGALVCGTLAVFAMAALFFCLASFIFRSFGCLR